MKNYVTSKKERLSYGGYFLGQNIIFMIVLQFLMLFYTDVIGISAASVGILFFIARTWDAVNDPMLGILVDKMNPKKGKFKPWISAVILLMPIATIFLFINPNLGGSGNLAYAYVTYIIWGMVYTISDVPIFALATVMTPNNDERVTLITFGRVAAMIAGLISGVIFMPIVTAMGWTNAVIILSIVAFITMIPIKFFAIERIKHDRTGGISFGDIFKFIKINKPLIAFYSAFLIGGAANTMLVAGPYFAKYLLGDVNLVGLLTISGLFPMLVLLPLVPKMIKKFGKKKIFIYGYGSSIVFTILMYVVGYDSLPVVLILNLLRSAGVYVPMMMMGMFSADFVEYGHYKSGKRAEGVSFSVQTFATKFSQAIGAVIGGFLLGNVYGYVENAEQTTKAMDGIWQMYTIIPTIGMFFAVIIIFKWYHLKESDVQLMIESNNKTAA